MNYLNRTFNRTAAASTSTDYDDAAAALADDITSALAAFDSRIRLLSGGNAGLLINNKIQLLIEGNAVSGSRTLTFTVRSGADELFSFYAGCQVGSSGETAKQFRMNIHMAIDDNVFSLIIRSAKTTGENFTAQILLVTAENGISAVGYNTCGGNSSWTAASSNRNFASDATLFDLRDNTQSVTILHRLPYCHEGTNKNIASLSGKVLLSGDMRIGDVNITDCSKIAGDSTYPYDDREYYAIDNNTLI